VWGAALGALLLPLPRRSLRAVFEQRPLSAPRELLA